LSYWRIFHNVIRHDDTKEEVERATEACVWLADPYVKTRMQLDKDWYRLQTALTLVQSLGRSIRSADDHATSYILDGDFGFFMKDAESILPQWWLDSIEVR